jgi:glycosyltransferase involved in cell wall biosynthesis
MRLAYLDPHAVPDDVPEALQILHTLDGLGGAGVQVVMITPKPRRPLAARDILGHELSPTVRLQHLPDLRKRWWFPSGSNQPFYFLATRALRKLAVDAVLVRNLKMAEYLHTHLPQLPLVFETHEIFAQTYREEHPHPTPAQAHKLAALVAREGEVYRWAKGLLALTPFLIEDIRQVYGVTTPAAVAPDGVDLRMTEKYSTAAPAHSPPVLLYLGSLHPWKGVNTLIEALVLLKLPARLRIVGGNDRRLAELRALAETLGVSDKVDFTGPCAPGDRFDVIHAADICLLPLTATSIASRYTSPLKLFEYLALGKPVVVSDLPSMRSVLEPGKQALMAQAGDAAAFAAAIDRLLADPELRRRLGTAARERARDFGWDTRGARIKAFIEGILKTGPDRG